MKTADILLINRAGCYMVAMKNPSMYFYTRATKSFIKSGKSAA
jgi:hypothetical protein